MSADAEDASGIRCPTGRLTAGGDAHTIMGCGSTNVAGPDDEGLFDCLDCGIWFDPTLEATANVTGER